MNIDLFCRSRSTWLATSGEQEELSGVAQVSPLLKPVIAIGEGPIAQAKQFRLFPPIFSVRISSQTSSKVS